MGTNVFLVQLDLTTIQHQENVNYVHQDLLTIKLKEDAHVLSKLHTYIKTVLVLIANHHISGTVKPNHVTLVH